MTMSSPLVKSVAVAPGATALTGIPVDGQRLGVLDGQHVERALQVDGRNVT
jgi:hypothetical protein